MARAPSDIPLGRGRIATAGVFVFFVVVGVVFIVFAKTANLSAAVVTGFPIVVMLAYAAFISFGRWFRLRDDQAGDNLYYMGFLFTLTSLGVSLYQFDADGSIDQILRNFGIAVGSTIAGVALRVFFNQMRRDPVEIEAAARLELAEASRRVRSELDNLAIEVGQFVRTSRQAARDNYLEIEASLKEVTTLLADVSGELTKSSKALGRGLSGLTKKLSEFETLDRALDAQVGPVAAAFAAEVEKLRSGLEAHETAMRSAMRGELGAWRQEAAASRVEIQSTVRALEGIRSRFDAAMSQPSPSDPGGPWGAQRRSEETTMGGPIADDQV